jgi:hypothetical protein
MTPETRASIVNAIKAGAWTALFAFIVLFFVALVGFLTEVASWASSSGVDPLPDISTLGYAFVAAVASALIGLVNAIVRALQAVGVLPGAPPSYPSTVIDTNVLE